MDNIVLRCLNGNNIVRRDQLESVVPKKKVNEVYKWFREHFVTSSRSEYINRCPYIVLQGPTGCGKTSTLKCIAHDLKIPIKEYGETIDTTAISYNVASSFRNEYIDEQQSNKSQVIDRKRAAMFEHFVIDSIRYNAIGFDDDASDEFDSDSMIEDTYAPKPKRRGDPGIIIHIETPLAFSRSQRVLLQSLFKLLKAIREIARHHPRRVAIVFEILECDKGTIPMPTKVRLSLGINVVKFNPITRANMKKFVEAQLSNYHNLTMDRESIELLVNDSDGDLRACLNTLRLLSEKSQVNKYFKVISNNNELVHQNNKKQKIHHQPQVKLKTNLMRDITRSFSFFHVLGKIFYQKRLYPEATSGLKPSRGVDRPFPTENSTEYLADRLDVEPNNFLPWLHQHYNRFCHDNSIDKAASFMEHLADVDSISIHSTQSSQFYELHNSLDQLQIYLAIESTVFSLYEDQTKTVKSSHKKMITSSGNKIIKSSVENCTSAINGELYSFNKPISSSLYRLVQDHQSLLESCTARLMQTDSTQIDPVKVLIDYVPYLIQMSNYYNSATTNSQMTKSTSSRILENQELVKLARILDHIEIEPKIELETRHERLVDLLDELEMNQNDSLLSES